MPVYNSKKVILLTENHILSGILPGIFLSHGLETETSPELSDPAVLRSHIADEGNTSFLRKSLINFIRREGIPPVIALDLRMQSGLDEADDPESLKLARTLVASCVLLSRANGFENFRAHLLLLADSTDPLTNEFEQNPGFLLKGMTTTDESLNSYIRELLSDDKLFHSLFFIWILRMDRERDDIVRETDIFLKGVLARIKFTRQEKSVPEQSSMHNGGDKPATVLLSLADGSVFADGIEQAGGGNEYGKLRPDVITLTGLWNHRTQKAVAEKILHLVTKGIPGKKKMRQDEEIRILADERCVMDGSTAVSAAGLLVRELAQYKKIRLIVNEENAAILRKSQGYSMIREFIRYTE